MKTIADSQTPAGGVDSTGEEKGGINPSPSIFPTPERPPRVSSRRLVALRDVREADDLAVANARHRSDRMFIERVKLGWVPQTEADWMNVGVAALVIRQPSDRIRYVESSDPDAGPVEYEPSFKARILSIEQRLTRAQQRFVAAQEALDQIQQDQRTIEQDPRPFYDQALAVYQSWKDRLLDVGIEEDSITAEIVEAAWERSPVERRGPAPFHPDLKPDRVKAVVTLDQIAERVSAVTRAQEILFDEIADAPWVAFRLGLGPDPSICWEIPGAKKHHGHYSGGESLTLVSVRKARERARESLGRIPIHPPWAADQTLMLEWILTHLGERPSRAHTIHRTINGLGYVPGNLSWATKRTQRVEQDRNR
jgi:hypothetical protein